MTSSPAPPKLILDDGSRLKHAAELERHVTIDPNDCNQSPIRQYPTPTSIRNPLTSIQVYYEVDRVAQDIIQYLFCKNGAFKFEEREDGFLCRVALQFPDSLLADAAQVTWEMEEAITSNFKERCTQDLASSSSSWTPPPLVFILGDTTYTHCCPDEIGALHLNADIIVHYGTDACFSPTERLPVVYSFGIDPIQQRISSTSSSYNHRTESQYCESWSWDVQACATTIIQQLLEHRDHDQIIILYQPQYQREMNDLRDILFLDSHPIGLQLKDIVVATFITSQSHTSPRTEVQGSTYLRSSSCGCRNACDSSCTSSDTPLCSCTYNSIPNTLPSSQPGDLTKTQTLPFGQNHARSSETQEEEEEKQEEDKYDSDGFTRIGNLQVPLSPHQISQYLLLYIGDEHSNNHNESSLNSPSASIHPSFLHILIRTMKNSTPTTSAEDDDNHTITSYVTKDMKPKACWAYHPQTYHLCTQPILDHEPFIRRYLNRRFYLIQRAALAQVMGILVGTLSQQKFRTVISQLQSKIQNSGRACYTMAVGKIHQISKLANFAEVDCFVLVACNETSILPNERDYHVPILTPYELDIALGLQTWDPSQWSCDYFDYLFKEEKVGHTIQNIVTQDQPMDSESDQDQPFYSLITGKYESKKSNNKMSSPNPVDYKTSSLTITAVTNNHIPGGQIIEYQSEAVEFWKRREYKGLEANVGKTEVQAAIIGQSGIASDYGNR